MGLSLEAEIRASDLPGPAKEAVLLMLRDRSELTQQALGHNALLRVLLAKGPISVSKDEYSIAIQQEVESRLSYSVTVTGDQVVLSLVGIPDGTTEQTSG